MRSNPLVPIASTQFIQFPVMYKFTRTVHGIEDLASMHDKIHPYLDFSRCMEASNIANKLKPANCSAGSMNQDFYFNARLVRLCSDTMDTASTTTGMMVLFTCALAILIAIKNGIMTCYLRHYTHLRMENVWIGIAQAPS